MLKIQNFEKHKAEIKKRINDNQHTDALIYLSEVFHAVGIKEKLELIDKLHHLEGHMPGNLGAYRMEIGESLEILALSRWDNEQVKELFSI